MSILNFPSGNSCCNLVRMQSPIKVAKEQWGTVGLKAILITNRPGDSVNSVTSIKSSWTTSSSSNVSGFSVKLYQCFFKVLFNQMRLEYVRLSPKTSPIHIKEAIKEFRGFRSIFLDVELRELRKWYKLNSLR